MCFTRVALLSLVLAGTVAAGETTGFRWVVDEEAGAADLLYGDQPAVRYMFAFDTSTPQRIHETYKVYHHVFGPGTKTIVTKGPGGKYTHHRGLYVGWNKTSTRDGRYDFWHCSKGAHLRHVKFLKRDGDARSGSMTAVIHWNDSKGKPVIVEERTVEVARDGENAWIIDWSTKLASRRGDIKLSGDRQHAGFQFRAHNRIAETNAARYIRPKGHPQQPGAYQVNDGKEPNKHVNLGWLAMHYELEGKTFTAEYFEDPASPQPSRYSERPYGRFGAFYEATVTEAKPLTMRYRIRVSTGKPPTQASIQKRYDEFKAALTD